MYKAERHEAQTQFVEWRRHVPDIYVFAVVFRIYALSPTRAMR